MTDLPAEVLNDDWAIFSKELKLGGYTMKQTSTAAGHLLFIFKPNKGGLAGMYTKTGRGWLRLGKRFSSRQTSR